MRELHAALIALQELDREIAGAEARVAEYGPQLDALLAPSLAAEREYNATVTKLEELRTEQRNLETRAAAKWEKYQVYQDRLAKARGTRDESPLRVESDLVRSAAEADEADKRQYHEQVTRTDLKVDELKKQLDKLRAEVADRQTELELGRMEAQQALDLLKDQRENQAVRLDPASRRLYDRLRQGKSRNVLAPLTTEGACGNCFNILPVQEQVEVRRGEKLHRCEGCGVILYDA
ncbi:MAG TPA: C4-type zinc ribbon domain-containing protein [Longimicrobiales bacterium]|nr:C4-type zinc ribbon domain-containing protein [Longimicrobiales bacterium]